MIVDFSKIKQSWLEGDKDIKSSFYKVLNSGYYIAGKSLDNFEKEYALYCNAN